MEFVSILDKSGMKMTEFSQYFGIPYRTVQDWKSGSRKCPDYLLDLLEYKLIKENIITVKEEKDMSVLKNSYDKELCIETLEEAKKYIGEASREVLENITKDPSMILLDTEEERLNYIESFKQYVKEIEEANSLEDIADTWNSYTDVYENGSEMYVE